MAGLCCGLLLASTAFAQLEEVEFLLQTEADRGRSQDPPPVFVPLRGEPAPGTVRTFDGMEFVFIPGGEFERGGGRGGGNAGPRHRVTLTRSYWLGRYEVTQAQWRRVMASAPWQGAPHAPDGPDQPATHVSYDDALAFVAALNRTGAGGYRLPTEAEWERACRAGGTEQFAFGNDSGQLGAFAWFSANAMDAGNARPQPVGALAPNAWGLYDMHGNVMEWCADWYDPYSRRHQSDPQGPANGNVRVVRGGSWLNLAPQTASAHRTAFSPDTRTAVVGFRIAKRLEPSELNIDNAGR